MCIRDRTKVVGAKKAREMWMLCRKYPAQEAREMGLVNTVAVSYTHLRAHETVLDLVCRLLLEKKKNK